jgi:hypothetical protein
MGSLRDLKNNRREIPKWIHLRQDSYLEFWQGPVKICLQPDFDFHANNLFLKLSVFVVREGDDTCRILCQVSQPPPGPFRQDMEKLIKHWAEELAREDAWWADVIEFPHMWDFPDEYTLYFDGAHRLSLKMPFLLDGRVVDPMNREVTYVKTLKSHSLQTEGEED